MGPCHVPGSTPEETNPLQKHFAVVRKLTHQHEHSQRPGERRPATVAFL